MNDRKTEILFSIINSYIIDGEPIGSKSLADEYSLNISPATIRNEMSSLEKMGLLEKAHTSSGRLPSDKGYRLFVDYILKDRIDDIKSEKQSKTITNLLDKRYHNTSDIVETATKILADLTNLTAISLTLNNTIQRIVNLELIRLSKTQLLLLEVFDNGVIINERIYIHEEIPDDDLLYMNKILRKVIVGSDVNEVSKNLESFDDNMLKKYDELIKVVHRSLTEQSFNELNREIKIEGLGNIFNFKEYDNLSRAKEFIRLFDSKDVIDDLLINKLYDNLDITIGSENEKDELKNNTVITSYFKINEDTIGRIGIVGITRINYVDVISNIMMISDLLNK